MGRISEKTKVRHRRTGSFIRHMNPKRTDDKRWSWTKGVWIACRLLWDGHTDWGRGSNTGGASTLHIISHDSFREHTLLADTTNGDEQDHSVGGGANVRLPPPPQSKAYSSSISRRMLNCLVKKENQIKKTKIKPRNEWERT